MINNLSTEDSVFLTTSDSETNNTIKEKIYTQMLNDNDNDNDNIDIIGRIILKSDNNTIEKMVNIISSSSNNDTNSNLSLQVLSSVADANAAAKNDPTSSNITFLDEDAQNQVNKLIENAVANASSDPESIKMLANVITKSDVSTVGTMLNAIATESTNNQNSNLAAQVLSSVASTVAISNTNENSTTTNQVNNFINTITEITETIEAAAEYNSDGYNASQNYIETYNLIISGGGSP